MIDTHGINAGHKLGRYELLVPVAQGGMATVWAARLRGSRGFSKLVAIKTLLPALSDDPRFEQMFLSEAQIASHIKHANCCEILDLGEQERTLYIVMEWVDGEPVRALQRASMRGSGFPASLAVHIGIQTAMGLHGAHELKDDSGELIGLVHRDVSPGNILVTYEGAVKIVDFGIAKAARGTEPVTTNAGEVKGTLSFMSPEQARGDAVDRRGDIFALGVVLYQLISAKHPFQQQNEFLTVKRIIDNVPAVPLASAAPGCPPSLHAAIMRAIEKKPERRYSTMAEFAKALERAAMDLPPAGSLDLAAFAQGLLVDRGERRRKAIKDAIKMIDERPASSSEPVHPRPFVATMEAQALPSSAFLPGGAAYVPSGAPYIPGGPPSVPDVTTGAATLDDATTGLRLPQTTTQTATTAARRGTWMLVVGLGALLLVAGTVGAIRTFGKSGTSAARDGNGPPVSAAGATGAAPVVPASATTSTTTTAASAAAPSDVASAQSGQPSEAAPPAGGAVGASGGGRTSGGSGRSTATAPTASTKTGGGVRLPTDPGF